MYFGKALVFDFGCNFSQHLQKCPAVELLLKSEMADAFSSLNNYMTSSRGNHTNALETHFLFLSSRIRRSVTKQAVLLPVRQ